MTRGLLESIFRETLAGVDPYRATRDAVGELTLESPDGIAAIAIGKGAHAMLHGAMDALRERDLSLDTAFVVGPDDYADFPPCVRALRGDHPVPGGRSRFAADELERWLPSLGAEQRVLVLVSGGATSLMAAPITDIPADDLVRVFELVLASGTDIVTMNAIRKRILRFGAGRLAVALAPRPVDLLLVSDVLTNDAAAIGSGPCTGDSLTAAKIRRMADRAGFFDALPPAVREYLDDVYHQRKPETPKPGSTLFRTVSTRIVLSNSDAVRRAADGATRLGASPVRIIQRPLVGEAQRAGSELAMRLIAWCQQLATAGESPDTLACTVAGGETTVTLGAAATGLGGRCQELALAAARELHRFRPRSDSIALLAAGTDGRDGPTDAAGAIVTATTWSEIAATGIDPERALAAHDSWTALDSAGALLRTGLTGTNVNDLIVAIVRPAVADALVPTRAAGA
ncbi:MAG: D-glycerate 2-kinase [Gemmatimonadaceae bacterium]|nr:D-glycerate 2-kinase [Gemmatimonadaceae bacterium]